MAASAFAAALLLGTPSAQAETANCSTPLPLAIELAQALGACSQSLETLQQRRPPLDVDNELLPYGMCCDGPWSCSPRLMTALVRHKEHHKEHQSHGHMCVPGEPDCEMQPGEPYSQERGSMLRVQMSPLQPDAVVALPIPMQRLARVGWRVSYSLCDQEVLWRLERPPRT